MTVDDYPSKYPGFFDLDFVRRTVSKTQEMSDAQLLATMLDPKNTSPHNPNCIFDGKFYRKTYLTKKQDKGENPILHYLAHGVLEGAKPNLLFEPAFFRKNAGTSANQFPTLVEYALDCTQETIPSFHPFIDVQYLSRTLNEKGHENFLEAIFLGELKDVNPHPIFDLAFINQHADKKISTVREAIIFYWQSGQDISTHILFNIEFYKSHFGPEVDIVHSVYHYLVSDHPQSPHPLFDPEFYKERACRFLGRAPSRGFEHFLTQGQEQGIDPSPYFDLKYYRAQSECGLEALQHFVSEGYKRFSAHPMIKLEDPTLFERTYGESGPLIGKAFVNNPKSIPLSATPDFAPHFFAKKLNDQTSDDNELRETYLRDHYFKNMPSNGLLSPRYIAQCGQITTEECDDPLRHYFRSALHKRQRILIALENLEDNLQNRAWLSLLESQINNLEMEFILVALKGGGLRPNFANIAHIWVLAGRVQDTPSLEVVMESGRLLARNLLSNAPCVAFVEANTNALLLPALSVISTKKIVFGGSGMMNLQTEDLDHISLFADKVLCEREREKTHLEERLKSQPSFVEAGFKPALPTSFQSTGNKENKRDIRTSLDLPEDAIIVLASGAMELENGIDIFGALAAKYCSHQNSLDHVHFIWHGNGPKHPNSPWFYAQYFVEIAAGKGRIQSTEKISLDEMIANADVYFDHPRDGSTGDGAEKAKAAGLAVMLAKKQTEDSSAMTKEGTVCFEPFDLDKACEILMTLCAEPDQREQLSASAYHNAETTDNFVDQIKSILVKIDVADNLETVSPSDLLLLVLDKDIVGPLSKLNGVKSMVQGREIIRVDTASIPSKGIPRQLHELIQNCDCTEVAIHFGMANLQAEYMSHFSKALCFAKGSPTQIEDLYRIGLEFDKILVEDASAIKNMSAINPKISAMMLAIEGA